jgi:hypothetical protein
MMNKFVKTLSVTAVAAAMFGAGALQAAGRRSEPLEIPFDFTVHGKHLPAGEYRLQRGSADAFAALVNVRTGARVQVLRTRGNDGNKPKLVFEHDGGGYVLRKVS